MLDGAFVSAKDAAWLFFLASTGWALVVLVPLLLLLVPD